MAARVLIPIYQRMYFAVLVMDTVDRYVKVGDTL
jgi:hypothetical protein